MDAVRTVRADDLERAFDRSGAGRSDLCDRHREGVADQTGGIALDGTTLFYAPLYATGSATQPTFASAVYAFDTTNAGALLWKMPTHPASAISNLPVTSIAVALGNGAILVAEGKTVTIMSLATGATKWTGTETVMGSLVNPILVGDRVYAVDTGGALVALQSAAP